MTQNERGFAALIDFREGWVAIGTVKTAPFQRDEKQTQVLRLPFSALRVAQNDIQFRVSLRMTNLIR